MKEVKTEMVPFEARLYCDDPCGEELKTTSSATGILTRYFLRCKNGHDAVRHHPFPRIVYEPKE